LVAEGDVILMSVGGNSGTCDDTTVELFADRLATNRRFMAIDDILRGRREIQNPLG
jgi:hypothetical protein